MDRLSYSTFGVARTFMALAVFFCHVFECFNDFGFLFVGTFFFMSGYGMEFTSSRHRALVRLAPYVLLFAWFSCIYFIFFQRFPYPSSWFLVVYFVVMVLYRFFSCNIYVFTFSLAGLGAFFQLLDFNWVWSASFGAFLFGVFFARNPSKFTLKIVACFVPLIFLFPLNCVPALWGVLPLFSWIVLSFASFKLFRPLAFLGQYTFFFYCVHCFVLGLFGATWTLGGSPSLYGVVGAFLCSCVASVFFKDYLFKYPRLR